MEARHLVALLNGREMGDEITDEMERAAKDDGLVVIFGYSDDNVELRGAIHDEISAYNGTTFHLDAKGVLLDWDDMDVSHENQEELRDYFLREGKGKKIEAVWSEDDYSWTYKTDVPHHTFDVMEDGEKFCRGIVLSVKDLA